MWPYLGKPGLTKFALKSILNALQCIETDSNDSQRIYNVFLQTQAIAFNVLECFSNVVQCIGNASKTFIFIDKISSWSSTQAAKNYHWWLDIDMLENVPWRYNFFSGTVMTPPYNSNINSREKQHEYEMKNKGFYILFSIGSNQFA